MLAGGGGAGSDPLQVNEMRNIHFGQTLVFSSK